MAKPSPRPRAVREPVQVYLEPYDRDLLNRLSNETGLAKAEILWRGMRSFAREQSGSSPMLRFLTESVGNDAPAGTAADHDAVLAESHRRSSKKRR